MRGPLPGWRGRFTPAALRPRETPAAWAASRARMASGSRTVWTGAGAVRPPGMSRLPGRRMGSPVSVRRVGGAASTRSAASQPASTSESAQGRSPVSALSQLERSDRKIGVSSSSIGGGRCGLRVVERRHGRSRQRPAAEPLLAGRRCRRRCR